MVLQTYTFAGLFMSAPLPEYTISGSYSSDRLRGARPKGSPRRLAVADRDVSSHQTTTKRHVHDSGHFSVRVSKATFRLCTTKLITNGIGTRAGCEGHTGPVQGTSPRTKTKSKENGAETIEEKKDNGGG